MSTRAKQIKRPKYVEPEKPTKPMSVQLRDMWRKNKFACVSLAIIAISMLVVVIFSRSSYIKSWARSQGFSYSADYNYKIAKNFLYFDALSRGQKSYAFNVMQGDVEFQNKSADNAIQKTHVKAFDFCYTEVKAIQQNKRISRMEKTQEISALVFDARGYTFKPMIVTPREMQVESDFSDLPTQQADPDVEEHLRGPEKDKDSEEERKGATSLDQRKKDTKERAQKLAEGDAGKSGQYASTDNATNTTNADNATDTIEATQDESTKGNVSNTETQELDNDTHPLSTKFNSTFKIEANDHVQANSMLPATLKQLLLDHSKFFIDFQEDQFMIYREYTMEPEQYSEALKLVSLTCHLWSLFKFGSSSYCREPKF
jgi:hypothetical protein